MHPRRDSLFGVALLCLILLLAMSGCTKAGLGSIGALGNDHEVTLYALDGSVIQTWRSSGKVLTGENGTRWAFIDKKTDGYVRISGGAVIVKTLY